MAGTGKNPAKQAARLWQNNQVRETGAGEETQQPQTAQGKPSGGR